MSACHQPRTGFTLFDLLVLLGVIVVTLALMPSALLRMRDAADERLCVDNLKKITLAAHDYHAAYDRLPPGWVGAKVYGTQPGAPDSPSMEAPMVGVLVYLLPYLGWDNLEKELYFQRDVYAWTVSKVGANLDSRTKQPYVPAANIPWWKWPQQPVQKVDNLTWAKTEIKTLMCPLDTPFQPIEATYAYLSVYANALSLNKDGTTRTTDAKIAVEDMDRILTGGKFDYKAMRDAKEFGRTNYVGVCGTAGSGSRLQIAGAVPGQTWGLYEGVFYNRSVTTLGQITAMDGTANTLMFGETLGGMERVPGQAAPVRKTFFSWFCGALPTLHGLAPVNECPWNSFGGKHQRGVPFAFCDGSVRFIKRGKTAEKFSNDWWVLQELAGKRDGNRRDTAALIDD